MYEVSKSEVLCGCSRSPYCSILVYSRDFRNTACTSCVSYEIGRYAKVLYELYIIWMQCYRSMIGPCAWTLRHCSHLPQGFRFWQLHEGSEFNRNLMFNEHQGYPIIFRGQHSAKYQQNQSLLIQYITYKHKRTADLWWEGDRIHPTTHYMDTKRYDKEVCY